MMAAVAFLALALAVIVQFFRLNLALDQALVREQKLRAEAEFQRAQAEAQYRQALAILEKERQASPAAPKP